MSLIKSIKPGAHIHYHDNGAWVIYAKEPVEGKKEPKILFEGSHEESIGYVPEIVYVMAHKLGMTADSM